MFSYTFVPFLTGEPRVPATPNQALDFSVDGRKLLPKAIPGGSEMAPCWRVTLDWMRQIHPDSICNRIKMGIGMLDLVDWIWFIMEIV